MSEVIEQRERDVVKKTFKKLHAILKLKSRTHFNQILKKKERKCNPVDAKLLDILSNILIIQNWFLCIYLRCISNCLLKIILIY